jgi:AcrR family transcriptional regulator
VAVISQSSATRGKLPRGPHRLTDEQVAEDQHRRLIEAMVALAGERGYAATTVADIVKRAEVSRKTFYEHFKAREDLLLAAFDAACTATFDEVRAGAQRTGGPTRQFEALIGRLARIARARPGTIALSTIEIAAVEPAGLERREQLMGAYGALIDECLGAGHERPALPATLARALAGGIHRTIDAQLRMGHRDELAAISIQLARWTRSHHPVPPALTGDVAPCRPWPWVGGDGLLGGRAPGTLALSPAGYEPPREVYSRGFVHHSNRERILDAVAQLTAAHGYTELTALSIAKRADISERAFLAHFKNKDDAFSAAVEVGHMKGQAIVERARAQAPNWRTGVRNAVSALLEFLASEPYFTRLAFVDAPLAGPEMIRRLHEHAGAYAHLLLDGAPQRKRPPTITPEATMHSLFELAFHQAGGHKTAELTSLTREATYLVLAPYVGVSEAAEVAASDSRRTLGTRAG